MNPESENFEKLHKLLILKRYEQPPPGYFPRLQGVIIARIHQGEADPTFWTRITDFFTLRPAMAWGIGLATCGVVALNVIWVKTQPREAISAQGLATAWQTVPPTLAAEGAPMDPSQPLHVANWLGNTNPALAPDLPSLFNTVDHRTVEAGYIPAH